MWNIHSQILQSCVGILRENSKFESFSLAALFIQFAVPWNMWGKYFAEHLISLQNQPANPFPKPLLLHIMGVYPAQCTAYACTITQSYHIYNSPLPPHPGCTSSLYFASQACFLYLQVSVLAMPLMAPATTAQIISGFSMHSCILQAVRHCGAQSGMRIYSPFASAEDFECLGLKYTDQRDQSSP
jgi:hypothetical protein